MTFSRAMFAALLAAAALPRGARALPGKVTRLEAGAQLASVDHLLQVASQRGMVGGTGVALPIASGSRLGVLGGLSAGASRRGELFAVGASLDLRISDVGFSGRLGTLGGFSVRFGSFAFEVMGEGGAHFLPVLADPLSSRGRPSNLEREGSTTPVRPFVGGRASLDWFRGRDERKFLGLWLGVRQDLGTWRATFEDREGPLGTPMRIYAADSAAFEALVGFRIGVDFADG